MLGDLAIEGGNFTAAYFKKDSVKELFDLDKPEETTLTATENVSEKSVEQKDTVNADEKNEEVSATTNKNFEEVLMMIYFASLFISFKLLL